MAAKKQMWIAAGLVLAIAGGAGGWAKWQADKAAANKDKEPPALEFALTEMERPQQRALPERLEFTGTLSAPRTAVVRAKSPGTLAELHVAEGTRVRAGDVVGRIELSDLDSRLQERKVNVEAARFRRDEARRNLDKNEQLARQNFISPSALDSFKTTLDVAQISLEAAQAQFDALRATVKDTRLIAPIGGVVGRRTAQVGEKLSGDQEVVSVVDLSTLELAVTVPSHELAKLRVGMALDVTVEGAPKALRSRLDRIAPTAETGSRAVRVIAVLPNPGEVLRAGQYASASVDLPDPTPRWTVPSSALRMDSGQTHVWGAGPDARLLRRVVTTGRRSQDGRHVEILSGLPPDTPIVVAQFDDLKEGRPFKWPGLGAAAVAAPTPATTASATGR